MIYRATRSFGNYNFVIEAGEIVSDDTLDKVPWARTAIKYRWLVPCVDEPPPRDRIVSTQEGLTVRSLPGDPVYPTIQEVIEKNRPHWSDVLLGDGV